MYRGSLSLRLPFSPLINRALINPPSLLPGQSNDRNPSDQIHPESRFDLGRRQSGELLDH